MPPKVANLSKSGSQKLKPLRYTYMMNFTLARLSGTTASTSRVATCDQIDLVPSAASPQTSMCQRQPSRHRSRILWTICVISSSIVSYWQYSSTAERAFFGHHDKRLCFDYSPRTLHIRLVQASASVKFSTNTAALIGQDSSVSQMP